MDEFLQRLQATNRKAAKLERLLLRLKQENSQLLNQITELESTIEEKERSFHEMKEKYEAAKLVSNMSLENGNHQDKEAVQAMIEEYIKEIDICLKNFGE